MRVARMLLPLLLTASTLMATPSFPPIKYTHRVLPNGLEVYAIHDDATPTVAIHMWYRVGSKHDPEGRSGFAHLFEHIMFKSTKNMPAEMLDRLTEDVGGFNNATTLDDATAYYEVVPSNYLETLLWAEAERLGSLNVDEANFLSERDVVKEEFRFRILAPPYGRLFYAIEKQSFTKHPYRRPGIGSIEELDAASIDDVKKFHATYYRPDNAVLIVAGDFDQKQLDEWVDKYFAPIPKPDIPLPDVNVPEPAREENRRVTEYAPNVPLPAVALTWLVPSASHADAAALALVASLLAEGESGRLQESLVRGEISQEVFATPDLREDLGLFSIVSIMGGDHQPAEAEKLILKELTRLASEPVPAAELQKVKNLMLTHALRERETGNGKAFSLGVALILEKDAAAVNSGLAKLQAVTAEDVQRIVKKYFIDSRSVVIDYRDESSRPAAQAGGVQ